MGRILCIGLGPGDPDLMSVKADRALRNARQIAFFRKKGRAGQARAIVEGRLHPEAREFPMEYPVTTEIAFDSAEYDTLLAGFYDEWTEKLAALAMQDDVVVLCEGDPFFYGSFMHLHVRLKSRVPVEVIPGITGMSGCWTATGLPITWGDDVLSVLAATLPEERLARHMREADAFVVMKLGRNLPKVRRALEAAGRLGEAWLVERGTMPGESAGLLADMPDAAPSYFSMILVHGKGRRPGKDAS